ncbi:FadR/GntR family transcriptional regulator [Paenibacillus sp. GCM10027628]|uniref:FadR/GntR family transcriptional regulator n=1 Tax=Paenibacillus sp. GCM10027628 TaxID=3273413 RepID=UPI003628DEC7
MNSGRISFQTVQRRQIVDDVVEQLQKKISLGELPVGSQIPTEPELMAQFGVGRSTIREAVRVLAHAGLLEKRQGHGTFVIGATNMQEPLDYRLRRAEVLDVYEVRFMLDTEIARLAAVRRDENDLAHIRECLELRNKHLAAGDNKLYLDADIAFHFAVAAATKNPVTCDLYRTFSEVLRVALDKHTTDPELHNHYTEQHVKLYEAIRDQDAEAAVACTLTHLEGVKRELEDLLR